MLFISKNARIFTNSGLKPQKKGSLLPKSANKETVLAPEFWDDNQYLGSHRPRTALQWHRACYFLWGTILAWGAQAVIWRGKAPKCPSWLRACCKFTAIYRTATIAFSLKRYGSKSVLLKK